jgi:O-antigen ligase
MLLGHGLGNKKVLLTRGQGDVNVVPIDNSWLSVYWETGILGALVVLAAVVATAVTVLRARTPYVRAATGFLLVFVAVASFNESGLSDVSTETLALLVAAMVADLDRWVVRRQGPSKADGLSPNTPAVSQ